MGNEQSINSSSPAQNNKQQQLRHALRRRDSIEDPSKKDEYFSLAAVTNTIKPLFQDAVLQSNVEAPGLLESFNLGDYLDSLLGRKKEVEEDVEGGNVSDKSESEEEVVLRQRGMFHKELERKRDAGAEDVTSAAAHPILLKGKPELGGIVELEDRSPWSAQFPIVKFEWFLSAGFNSLTFDEVESLSSGLLCEVPNRALGKLIKVVATRLVLDPTRGQAFRVGGKDIFDPRREGERGGAIIKPDYQISVKTVAVIGPILIPTIWSATLNAVLAADSSTILKERKRKVLILSRKKVQLLNEALLNEEEEEVLRLLDTSSSPIEIEISKDLKKLFIREENGEENLLSKFEWLSDYWREAQFVLPFKKIRIGWHASVASSPIPYIAISSSSSKSLLELCPASMLQNPWSCADHDTEFCILFITLLLFKTAKSKEGGREGENGTEDFPLDKKGWQKLLAVQDTDTVKLYLQKALENLALEFGSDALSVGLS